MRWPFITIVMFSYLPIFGWCGALSAQKPSEPCLGLETLGDLTPDEVMKIQAVVDGLGRKLVVIGSAATLGKRRNKGTDLRLTKGSSGKSDIDYAIPLTQWKAEFQYAHQFVRLHRDVFTTLPDIDTSPRQGGVLVRAIDPEKDRVWFRPSTAPIFLSSGRPNLRPMAWVNSPQDHIAYLENEITLIENDIALMTEDLQNMRPNSSKKRRQSLSDAVLTLNMTLRRLREELTLELRLGANQ